MKRTAFTLVELLTVIAIILILAAIIAPATMRAKDAAYRSSDMGHMNEIRSALQLYRVDQGAYPPALLGYATLYSGNPNQYIPADQIQSFLYPKRVNSINTFQPAYNRNATTVVTQAVWPNQDPIAPPGDPVLNLPDNVCARQAYGPGTVVTSNPNDPNSPPALYYAISGYDVAQVPIPGGGTRTELRYALFWTNWGLGTQVQSGGSPCTPSGGPAGNAQDDPRQLGYNYPPDNTVITWNTYFRDYDKNDVPQREKRDIVLFLGGGAKTYDSQEIYNRSWRLAQ